jgi:hypothetical protein
MDHPPSVGGNAMVETGRAKPGSKRVLVVEDDYFLAEDLRRNLSLVALSGRTLTVLDWERLAAFGEFERAYLHRRIVPDRTQEII